MKRALIIAAATIGSGVFALPYVMAQAGWLTALIYFVGLGVIVTAAHVAYFRTLAAEGEKRRLMGLARKYFGAPGFWFGFVGIVVGLLLSFVIFLIVGTQFVRILVPSLPYAAALAIFWLIIAIPALIGNRRVATLEIVSVICVTAIIIIVFATSAPAIAFAAVNPINLQNIFLPFGIVLFALAGWTGVEPFYETTAVAERRAGKSAAGRRVLPMLALGTGFAALLYWLFAAGILSSAPRLTADTISGLAAWPAWKRDLVAVFGILQSAPPPCRSRTNSATPWKKISIGRGRFPGRSCSSCRSPWF